MSEYRRMDGHFTGAMIVLLAIGMVIGIAVAGTTTWMVNATSSDNFCATECHSMKWVADAWKRGPHFGNPVSVHAGCSDCHIPYEDEHPTPFQYVFGTLVTKGISGFTDVYQTIRGEISDKATWEAEKPRLTAEVHEFFKKTGSMTCKGCHTLDQFKGSASAEMAEKIHSTKKDDDHVVCITCHTEIAHVYADSAAKP